jgi:hypothetical protein
MWHSHGVDGRDHRTEYERRADDEHPCERDVRVSVGHTAEDHMVIEQFLKSTEVHTHREDQQKIANVMENPCQVNVT